MEVKVDWRVLVEDMRKRQEDCSIRDQHIGYTGNDQRLLIPGPIGVLNHIFGSNPDKYHVEYVCERCGLVYLAVKSPEFLEREGSFRGCIDFTGRSIVVNS